MGYSIEDTEKEIVDGELAEELSGRIDENLGTLPTQAYDEDVPDHVEQHLKKMGYM